MAVPLKEENYISSTQSISGTNKAIHSKYEKIRVVQVKTPNTLKKSISNAHI